MIKTIVIAIACAMALVGCSSNDTPPTTVTVQPVQQAKEQHITYKVESGFPLSYFVKFNDGSEITQELSRSSSWENSPGVNVDHPYVEASNIGTMDGWLSCEIWDGQKKIYSNRVTHQADEDSTTVTCGMG